MLQQRPDVDSGMRYSSNDWVVTLLSTPRSYILQRILPHVTANVLVTLMVLYCHPQYTWIAIPMTGHSLLASSLGLLVSFRTNSAYSRFWEARGLWTSTKATCRNLAILVKMQLEPHAPKASALFLQQLAAWPGTLMHLCLGGAAELPDYCQALIPPQSLPSSSSSSSLSLLTNNNNKNYNNINNYSNQPAMTCMYLSMAMQKTLHAAVLESKTADRALVEAEHWNTANHMVQDLLSNMSHCEKILRTPVPWTYSRHTSRFLSLWLGTLPFALVGGDLNPWLVLVVVVLASYCLLGLEDIGHLIEQPFLGDPIDGKERLFSALDADGEASALIKRGQVRLVHSCYCDRILQSRPILTRYLLS